MEFEMISRDELVENIVSFRKQLVDLLAGIPQRDYLVPEFAGGWCIKDLLAHIAAWEQKMIEWIGLAAEGNLPPTPNSDQAVEAMNDAFHQANKDLSLDEVLRIFEDSYLQALAVAQNTPEAVLFTENPLEGREHPFWITVAANTYWHYKDHIDDINRWLAQKSEEAN